MPWPQWPSYNVLLLRDILCSKSLKVQAPSNCTGALSLVPPATASCICNTPARGGHASQFLNVPLFFSSPNPCRFCSFAWNVLKNLVSSDTYSSFETLLTCHFFQWKLLSHCPPRAKIGVSQPFAPKAQACVLPTAFTSLSWNGIDLSSLINYVPPK